MPRSKTRRNRKGTRKVKGGKPVKFTGNCKTECPNARGSNKSHSFDITEDRDLVSDHIKVMRECRNCGCKESAYVSPTDFY